MTDPFKKVQAGQPLDVSAQAWNAFLDNVRANKFKAHSRAVDPLVELRQSGIVKVRNDSGRDCNRFSVLGIGSPIISPSDNLREFKNQVAVSGIEPNHPDHFGKFAILLEPLRIGKIGRAWVSGACPAYVYVEDTCHEFADVAEGEIAALISRPSGSAKILWRQGGTGFQWSVVRLSNLADDIRRFKLTNELYRCGSASALRVTYSGQYGNLPTWCATDCGFTVHDSLGVVDQQPASVGTFGWAKWMPDSSRWEAVQLGEGCCGQTSSSSSDSSSSSNSNSSSSISSSSSSSRSSSHSSSSFSLSSSDSFGSNSSSSENASSTSSESSQSSRSSSFSSSDSSGSSSSGNSFSSSPSSERSGSDTSNSEFSVSDSSAHSSSESSANLHSSDSSSVEPSASSSTSHSISNGQISSDELPSSDPSSSGGASSESSSIDTVSIGASGEQSTSDPWGGLTGTYDVLLRCPVRDGNTVTFPAQRFHFVKGLLQSVETTDPCSFSVSDS